MKLAIVSDIHANIEALTATLAHADARGAERIVCLGDIVGYNTNPSECIALLRARDAFCIAGNHDRAATGQISVSGFNAIAARAVAWTEMRLSADEMAYLAALPVKAAFGDTLVLVHGALHPEHDSECVYLDTSEKLAASFAALVAHPSGARICAFGHTHQAAIYEMRDGTMSEVLEDSVTLHADAHYLINPGTVGQPRIADQRATYFAFDTEHATLALQRVDYDVSVPFEKTRREGLSRSDFVPDTSPGPFDDLRASGLVEAVKRVFR